MTTLQWSSTYVSNVAGVIAFLFSLVMWITSLYGVRRKMFLQSRQRSKLILARLYLVAPLNLPSPRIQYNPRSILFLNVASISKLQWHPFTVTSNCELEPDCVAIVSEGSWSQKLHKQLSSPSLENLRVSTEGPYGPSSFHPLR
ncbi:hypothetical protein M9H77_26677 [Catharanthus roseus]|uniref:Uncharacterized protein n=1 Tax=Catharanthus roseus TaxID=4058 RepID=A0ACC0ACI0_CATRO|nr:hypothetical protein M9H77_26677 [Catharanthus roseus]